jgi:aldose 1-epimerase
MHQTLSLQCQDLRCELLPALGGCVTGLWHGAQEVLRTTPPAQLDSAWNAASYPLVPYSNRLGYRRLEWLGRTYTLAPNFLPGPHNLHGVGWMVPWQVLQSDAQTATLQLQHAGDASWPFAFDSTQTFTLSPSALEMRMSVVNRAAHVAPLGLGWHPYFPKTAQTHVRFAAQSRWEMGADKLPTHSLPHAGLDTDCSSLQVDHCFGGWSGPLHLTQGSLQVAVTSDLPYLVVFTKPERDSIAIEPVSHVNNALALAAQTGIAPEQLGLRLLQPGETFESSMRIHVEHTA